MIIGTVGELWRYAVRSMSVERPARCRVGLQSPAAPAGYRPGKDVDRQGYSQRSPARCASFQEADHGQLAHIGMSVRRCGGWGWGAADEQRWHPFPRMDATGHELSVYYVDINIGDETQGCVYSASP
jgi:hypothetical protein